MVALASSQALVGTTFSRVLAGEYLQAGKQGSSRMGELDSRVLGKLLQVGVDCGQPGWAGPGRAEVGRGRGRGLRFGPRSERTMIYRST